MAVWMLWAVVSPVSWGKSIDVKTPFSLKGKEWKPICGTHDPTVVGPNTTSLTTVVVGGWGGGPSDPASSARSVSNDSLAGKLYGLRRMTSVPTFCWQLCLQYSVCNYSLGIDICWLLNSRGFSLVEMLLSVVETCRSFLELNHLYWLTVVFCMFVCYWLNRSIICSWKHTLIGKRKLNYFAHVV